MYEIPLPVLREKLSRLLILMLRYAASKRDLAHSFAEDKHYQAYYDASIKIAVELGGLIDDFTNTRGPTVRAFKGILYSELALTQNVFGDIEKAGKCANEGDITLSWRAGGADMAKILVPLTNLPLEFLTARFFRLSHYDYLEMYGFLFDEPPIFGSTEGLGFVYDFVGRELLPAMETQGLKGFPLLEKHYAYFVQK